VSIETETSSLEAVFDRRSAVKSCAMAVDDRCNVTACTSLRCPSHDEAW
jgi:hypothetical protein